jgi:hypothetical protein
MPAPPATAVDTNRPDPLQDRPATGADESTRTGRLLGLVRKLIDYGRQLAATLQQHTSITSFHDIASDFCTTDIGLILARITRGLERAMALEARLVSRPLRETPAPSALGASSGRQPRTTVPSERSASMDDPRLARMPTAAEIAADVRRRPIGAVIADIFRDLGIQPNNPLWRELSLAIIVNGGSLAKLVGDICTEGGKWVLHRLATMDPAGRAPHVPSVVAHGTGPP